MWTFAFGGMGGMGNAQCWAGEGPDSQVFRIFCDNPGHVEALKTNFALWCGEHQKWYVGMDDPSPLNGTIERFIFWNCQMRTLPKLFDYLGPVHEIVMDGNDIEVIDGSKFPSGSLLNKLSAKNNSITELPANLFVNTNQLNRVDFSENKITKIDPMAFKGTEKSMTEIILANNRINELNSDLFASLIGLRELDLCNNLIEKFQLNLQPNKNMNCLRFDRNKITRLDCNAFPSTAVDGIFVSATMNQLKEIDLSCNINCGAWSLHIDDNQLESLTFPSSMLVRSLETLTASRNNLNRISIDGDALNKLKVLRLTHNRLTSISLQRCDSLNILDLSNNNFRQLPTTTFGNVPNLRDLYVNDNELSQIDSETFTHAPGLRSLSLTSNRLEKFTFEMFAPKLENLMEIHLDNNRLNELTGSADSALPSLRLLDVSNNEFNCCMLGQFFAKNPRMIPAVKRGETTVENGLNSVHGVACRNDDREKESPEANRACKEEFWNIVSILSEDIVDALTELANHPNDFKRLSHKIGKTESIENIHSSIGQNGLMSVRVQRNMLDS